MDVVLGWGREACRERDRVARRRLVCAALMMTCLLLASAGAASAGCPAAITRCGCQMLNTGLYTVANDLSTSQTAGDCIIVRAKNAVLNLNGHSVTGPSNGKSKGSGVHVLKSAVGSFVEGLGATISGWKYGVENDANNVAIEDFTVQNNDTAGVFLSKANSSAVTNVTSQNNGGYGIWLSASSQNHIGSDQTLGNFLDGVFVGCVSSLGKCTTMTAASNGNIVFGVTSQNNGISGKGSGITVQFNSNQNVIGRNTAGGNVEFDLNDRHPSGCAKDVWFANDFVTYSRNCIN